MCQPLITIGITAFNAENTIARAVRSALSQTWKPVEIIIVDDASTDATFKVIDVLSKKNTCIQPHRHPLNRGVAEARNTILDYATGEFVAFFDDDDESLPNRISEQYQRITDYEKNFAEGAPVVCHTARRIIYPNNHERTESTMGLQEGKQVPFGPKVAKRILLGMPLEDGYGSCPTCSQMARLSTYRQLGGFDSLLRRGEDTDFDIRLAEVGGHFAGIAKPLVIQNMTKTSDKNLRDEYYYWRLIMEKHRAIMESEGQYEYSLAWLDMKQDWLERRRLQFIFNLLKAFLTNPYLTLRRLYLSFPNRGGNRDFSRFHCGKDD